MVSTRNVLTIFMASPGDVAQERAALADVVNSINQRVAYSLGWELELRGWENTVPGMGRPQSRINPEVRECDVFIGILWKRWGTPTGESSSGFREEFDIAHDRHSRSNDPEILMYFRDVDAAITQDPGEQFRQVQAFKDELTRGRDLLYKTYSDVPEFREQVENHLTQMILERARPTSPPAAAPGPSTEVPSEPFDLAVLLGNPTLSTSATLARWEAARQAPSVSLAPCALGEMSLWTLDPLEPDYGLTLIAGTTGSGKSNAVLAMAFALAFSLPPEYLRLSILDLESFQSVRVLEALGATSVPRSPHGGLDLDDVVREAKRREQRLRDLGHQSVQSLWRREPALREEFPVWVICADEAYQLLRDKTMLEKFLAVGGRVAGLGIHVVLGSQTVEGLGQLALATHARRIGLNIRPESDFVSFVGVHNPFGSAPKTGFATCVEGGSLAAIRFARVDDRRFSEAFQAAAESWRSR